MAEEFGGVGFGERVLAGAGCAVGGGRVLWVGLGFTERENWMAQEFDRYRCREQLSVITARAFSGRELGRSGHDCAVMRRECGETNYSQGGRKARVLVPRAGKNRGRSEMLPTRNDGCAAHSVECSNRPETGRSAIQARTSKPKLMLRTRAGCGEMPRRERNPGICGR